MAKVVRGTRITGAQRETLAAQYAKKYEAGQSIRKIADTVGPSGSCTASWWSTV
jgi:hypothetical protein